MHAVARFLGNYTIGPISFFLTVCLRRGIAEGRNGGAAHELGGYERSELLGTDRFGQGSQPANMSKAKRTFMDVLAKSDVPSTL